MNIRQITGDDEQGGVWQYVALSLSLMTELSWHDLRGQRYGSSGERVAP